MRIAFNENDFRAAAAQVGDFNDPDVGKPITVSNDGTRRRLSWDDQLTLRSLFVEVMNEVQSTATVFELQNPPTGSTTANVAVFIDADHDGEGVFNGLEFEASIAWRSPDFHALAFRDSDDALDIGDLGGDKGTLLDQVVALTRRAVEAINLEIERAESAWTSVFASNSPTAA